LLVVTVAGCWHEAPPPRAPIEPEPAAAPEVAYVPHTRQTLQCGAVAAAVVERLDHSGNGNIAQFKDVLIGVGTTSCQEDGWSQELLVCFNDAAGDKEVQACVELLSQEQKDKFGARFRSAFSGGAAAATTP
jgi:hypothetical protein